MAKAKGKKKNNNKTSAGGGTQSGLLGEHGMLMVDPERIRFQHSKIRPYFSGCGRSVQETLDSLRKNEIKPTDLPPIQVLVGPFDKEDGKPWYFSLNNRRLWVLKRCREEGLLESHGNCIPVRVREPRASERTRYTLQNCAVDAKFLREGPSRQSKDEKVDKNEDMQEQCNNRGGDSNDNDLSGVDGLSIVDKEQGQDSSSEDESDGSVGFAASNPFAALS